MAKEDFCFTYYDGDAARDMAHMNRLERGGYMDLIVSQRKFGRLSLDLIKKTLGSDFENIWESIRIVLRQDDESKFFVEWVEISVEKMRRQSVKQAENGKLGGRPKANKNPKETQLQTQTITQKKPLEDGDGNEDVLGSRGFGKSENLLDAQGVVPDMCMMFVMKNEEYPSDNMVDFPACRMIAQKIKKWEGLKGDITEPVNTNSICRRWGELVDFIRADQHFSGYSLTQINKHFQSIAQSFSNGRGQPHKQPTPGNSRQQGANQLLDSLRKDLESAAGGGRNL